MRKQPLANTIEHLALAGVVATDISASEVEQYKAILGVSSLPLAWSEKDLNRLGVRSLSSLRRDRVVGGGIPFVKDKGRVIYLVLEVFTYLKNNSKTSTSAINTPCLRKAS